MVTAYVMVKVNTAEADRLKAAFEDVDGVESCHIVAGDVDFIVKVVVDSPNDVKDIVTDSIQRVEGVEDTQTYISMD
jgi:DNA-binding Lrp family transcriptional regulator